MTKPCCNMRCFVAIQMAASSLESFVLASCGLVSSCVSIYMTVWMSSMNQYVTTNI